MAIWYILPRDVPARWLGGNYHHDRLPPGDVPACWLTGAKITKGSRFTVRSSQTRVPSQLTYGSSSSVEHELSSLANSSIHEYT
jgi:hypothetical protein